MRVLLDSHTFLWYTTNHPNLSTTAHSLIDDPDTEVFFSAASIWEIGIKVASGKMTLSAPLETLIPDQMQKNSFLLLPIEVRHVARMMTLPFHHRDPFDRILVAQSLSDTLPLVSVDGILDAYGITRLW